RALKYRTAINQFIANNRDLRSVELTMEDWDAVSMVSDWLLNFRAATTEMSATSRPMLSSTHCIFCGLQKTLKNKLAALPDNSPEELVEGLTNAHRKLSDYYYKFDQSPFYIWAALLDPRFNYKKLHKDYAGDPDLSKYLEEQKKALRADLDENYPASESLKQTSSAATGRMTNWMLDNYFDAPRIALDMDPVHDPGSVVAVERVFSGGRDTISLRRSSLKVKPETIHILMVLIHQLRLRRKSIEDALRAIVVD
ncbi:hypothetical protein C8F04DRAFT_961455, partial [Mycena alexandri]